MNKQVVQSVGAQHKYFTGVL